MSAKFPRGGGGANPFSAIRLSAFENIFYFISQCTSAPYLESGLCKLENELDNCNFTFFCQGTDLLIKVIMKCVN